MAIKAFIQQLILFDLVAVPIYLAVLYMSGVLPTYNHDDFREVCDRGCKEHLPDLPEGCQLNLLIIGQTGHGKSALRNYLLGQDRRLPQPASRGLVRRRPGTVSTVVGRRRLLVVESTGLDFPSGPAFDEGESLDKGYHAIIIVISSVAKISRQDKAALLYLPILFGERFSNFAVFVFTHCDVYARRNSLTESTNTQHVSAHILSTLDPEIKHVMKMSGGRYFFANKNDGNLYNQRLLLFNMIGTVDMLVHRNRGSKYTNDNFEAAWELVYRQQKQGRKSTKSTMSYIFDTIVAYIIKLGEYALDTVNRFIPKRLA